MPMIRIAVVCIVNCQIGFINKSSTPRRVKERFFMSNYIIFYSDVFQPIASQTSQCQSTFKSYRTALTMPDHTRIKEALARLVM